MTESSVKGELEDTFMHVSLALEVAPALDMIAPDTDTVTVHAHVRPTGLCTTRSRSSKAWQCRLDTMCLILQMHYCFSSARLIH